MNIYDKAHEMARMIRDTDEYKRMEEAREIAYENETNKTLLEEYKKMQFQLQISMAGGASASEEDLERFQRIAALLQMSPEASAYIMAEMQVQRLLADLYKILAEAADIHLDRLQG